MRSSRVWSTRQSSGTTPRTTPSAACITAGRTGSGRMTRHIVLMGMMGAGKTTVGEALAARLHLMYRDNDGALHARTGVDAATYAAQHGVEALHELEHDLLREALAAPVESVVGAPGSVALDASAADILDGADVVWLRARLA